ncbi:MAG: hypothetical protein WC135_01400 [Bacteroidales bacterium]
MKRINPLVFKENEIISSDTLKDYIKIIDKDCDINNPNKYLGLSCYNDKDMTFQTNYYIGLDWIVENELAIMVKPKIEGLDYLRMFIECFDCENKEAKKKLKDIYHIDFNREPINVENDTLELTPLLVVHFVKLMESLAKRNLKKDYIQIEENLNSTIKGKILFSQNLKQNAFKGRDDRYDCRHQDYSVDCIENRILKKTLTYVRKYLNNKASVSCKAIDLNNICNSCLALFEHVSDDLSIQQIKQFKVNPLFKDYADILKVAKLILRRLSYSIDNAAKETDRTLPPFWIDMPLLFEVYVLTILQKQYGIDNIEYQAEGKYGNVDYLRTNDPLIIGAKYKSIYSDRFSKQEDEDEEREDDESVKGRFKIEDIRQLSGYARDKGILKELNIEKENYNTTVIPCLIIYPLDDTQEEPTLDNLKADPIHSFTEFYKLGIKLPKR